MDKIEGEIEVTVMVDIETRKKAFDDAMSRVMIVVEKFPPEQYETKTGAPPLSISGTVVKSTMDQIISSSLDVADWYLGEDRFA